MLVSVDDSCALVVIPVATIDDGSELWFSFVSVDDSCSPGISLVSAVDDDSTI